jgi:hypothetical protein
MDATTIIWTVAFPLLLFFVAVGVGVAFAMTNSESIGFFVAKACFAAAAFDVVAFAIYWTVASRLSLTASVALPTIAAVIAVPCLVLSIHWLNGIEAKLSTRLYPGEEPMPGASVDTKIPNDEFRIYAGTNVAVSNNMPYSLAKIFGEDLLQVDRDKDGEVFVSVLKVFDDRNNIIARIDAEDCLWVDNSTRSKRPNKSTLVVFDHSDVEVLRLVFLNPKAISVTGIFRHPKIRRPIIVTSEYMDMMG